MAGKSVHAMKKLSREPLWEDEMIVGLDIRFLVVGLSRYPFDDTDG
jgi:hypothetical protein